MKAIALFPTVLFLSSLSFAQAPCTEVDVQITNETTLDELEIIQADFATKDMELQIDELRYGDDGKIEVLAVVVNHRGKARVGWNSVGTKSPTFEDDQVLRIRRNEDNGCHFKISD